MAGAGGQEDKGLSLAVAIIVLSLLAMLAALFSEFLD
ncbi:hypothetical protein LCGC14_2410380 [marine sediment metagenome]|uniref:Uncharacterized protein n=1 Tax=marine sediment metagenome TaxID=412755 RepID=A0A0F9E4U9_9ZZZZ